MNQPLSSWPESWGARPLYATARDESRKTDGGLSAVIARNLGTPYIPWQAYTSTVANERRPDGSYEYQVVIVSVPRQTGKTTLIRSEGTQRCLVCGRDVFYTAQTGKDARARWMDLVKALRTSEAFRGVIDVKLRGGSEHVAFPGGSVFQVFAPTPESLHGYTPPTVMLDEVFSLTASEGELLMGAIGPAQITIRDRQLWIVSTAGTAESTFLHDWIDRAMGGMPRVALFLWGASDQQDPYDLGDIAAFHPGVGHELNGKILTAEDVLANVDHVSRAEYERAFANRRTVTQLATIPADTWRTLRPDVPVKPPETSDMVLGYDVSVDRQAASIVAAWRWGDRVVVKLVRRDAGTAWLIPELSDLIDRWRPRSVVAVRNGPVLDTTARLRELYDVDELDERRYAAASGWFLSAIDEHTIAHDGDLVLERSVTGLVPRGAVVDGLAFSRRHSIGDSSAGIAAVVAARVADELAQPAPMVYFGRAAS